MEEIELKIFHCLLKTGRAVTMGELLAVDFSLDPGVAAFRFVADTADGLHGVYPLQLCTLPVPWQRLHRHAASE